jgi:hypothetical protein
VTGRSLPTFRPCSRAASMGRWVGNQESAGKLHREISRVVVRSFRSDIGARPLLVEASVRVSCTLANFTSR